MKIAQLRKVLDQTAEMYRNTGNPDVAESLRQFSTLFAGHDGMTVASFAKLVDKSLASSAPQ